MSTQTFKKVAEGVYKRAANQFLARTWRGGPSRTFPSKSEAVAWRRDTLSKRDKGAPVVVRRNTDTVAQECERWLEANARHLEPRTYQVYDIKVRRQICHPKAGIGARRLVELTHETIEEWTRALERCGYSVGTVNLARTVLGMVTESAVRAGRLGANPVRLSRALPTPRREPVTAADPADLQAVIDALPARLRIIALLALGAGLRLAEALGLKPEDVDTEALVLHVRRQYTTVRYRQAFIPPKGGKPRDVPVSASLVEALHAHEAAHGLSTEGTYVCLPRGGAYTARQWADDWPKATEAAGVQLTGVHQLRHAYGSYLVAAGESLPNVSAWMGHANLETTMRTYLHPHVGARPTADPLASLPGSARRSRTNRALRLVG